MKKVICIILSLCIIFALTGCGKDDFPELPLNATAFEMGDFIDDTDDDADYGTIEYNGRTYMPYGTLKNKISREDVDRCLGYIVQDGKEKKDERIYTLKDDTENNFLMQKSIGGIMDQPMFWRATDTREKGIHEPDYIDSLGYSYWD